MRYYKLETYVPEDHAEAVKEALAAAGALSRPLGPDRGKARLAVWAKGGWPPGTNTWASCADVLAKAGVTDVFLYAGSLSASLPAVSGAPADPGRRSRGDPFPAAVKALHARGIRVHAWIFALQADLSEGARYAAPGSSKRLRHAPGRTASLPWLDPAVKANGDDLVAWVRALAAKTGVDGVNLDYFRYPLEAKKKNPPANAGDLNPGLRRSLGRGNGTSLQYSCLENPMDRGAWQSMRLQRVRHGNITHSTAPDTGCAVC